MFEKYLSDLLGADDSQFQDESIILYLQRSPEELVGENPNPDKLAKAAKDPRNMADFGLKFIFDCSKDLVLSTEAVDTVYKGLCNVALRKQKEMTPIPEIDDTVEDEKKEEIAE